MIIPVAVAGAVADLRYFEIFGMRAAARAASRRPFVGRASCSGSS